MKVISEHDHRDHRDILKLSKIIIATRGQCIIRMWDAVNQLSKHITDTGTCLWMV